MTTLKQLIEKIEECQFECEAGCLSGLTQWQALKNAIAELPEYQLHQWVSVKINGEVQGVQVSTEKKMCIQAIRMESDTEKTFPVYGLTDDPCAPYHYGNPVKLWVRGNQINPTPASNAEGNTEQGGPSASVTGSQNSQPTK